MKTKHRYLYSLVYALRCPSIYFELAKRHGDHAVRRVYHYYFSNLTTMIIVSVVVYISFQLVTKRHGRHTGGLIMCLTTFSKRDHTASCGVHYHVSIVFQRHRDHTLSRVFHHQLSNFPRDIRIKLLVVVSTIILVFCSGNIWITMSVVVSFFTIITY